MTSPLTVIDTPVQLDGEPGHAWTWAVPEIGCPLLGNPPSEPAAEAGEHRKDSQ